MARVFQLSLKLEDDKGNKLASLDEIKEIVEGHKMIKQYAYILHDKCTYTETDYKKAAIRFKKEFNELSDLETKRKAAKVRNDRIKNLTDDEIEKKCLEAYLKTKIGWKVGDKKDDHIHVLCRSKDDISLEQIAKWFNVPENMIELPKGKHAFVECLEYLPHWNEKSIAEGKHRYENFEIESNFDWEKEIEKYHEWRDAQELYGDKTQKEYYRDKVLYEGMTINEVISECPDAYRNDMQFLDKARTKYLGTFAPLPAFRLNIYVDGKGGIGKNVASKAIACALFPDIEKPYFEVGGEGVSFDKYDGEPVVIWNDYRASSFIARFGREETFDIFDTHPTDSHHNIKYGSVRLTNTVNIINGVESYVIFLDGLSGEYVDKFGTKHAAEDKSQSYRRLPMILCIHEESFDMLLNKGFVEKSRDYFSYIAYQNISGSFARIAQRLDGAAKEKTLVNLCEIPVREAKKLMSSETEKIDDIELIPEEFLSYGKCEHQPEREKQNNQLTESIPPSLEVEEERKKNVSDATDDMKKEVKKIIAENRETIINFEGNVIKIGDYSFESTAKDGKVHSFKVFYNKCTPPIMVFDERGPFW